LAESSVRSRGENRDHRLFHGYDSQPFPRKGPTQPRIKPYCLRERFTGPHSKGPPIPPGGHSPETA